MHVCCCLGNELDVEFVLVNDKLCRMVADQVRRQAGIEHLCQVLPKSGWETSRWSEKSALRGSIMNNINNLPDTEQIYMGEWFKGIGAFDITVIKYTFALPCAVGLTGILHDSVEVCHA